MTSSYERSRVEQQLVATELQQAQRVGTGAAAPGVLVKVSGTAQPGPGGVLRAPLSGAECVWYQSWRISTTQPWSPSTSLPGPGQTPRPLPASASSTIPYVSTSGYVPPVDEHSNTPFAVADAAGHLLVDPALAHVDSAIQSCNEVRATPNTDWTGGELLVEWIIPVGAPVFVVGVPATGPDGSVRLTAPPGGTVVISTYDEQQLLSKAGAWTSRPARPAAPAGAGVPVGPDWVVRLLAQATPASTASAPAGTLVKIDGYVRPGPGGAQRGRLSGRDAVWTRAVEEPVRDRLAPFGFSAADPRGAFTSGDLPPDPSQPPVTFEVVDAHGQVLVDTTGAWVDSGTVSFDDFARASTMVVAPHGVLRREWIIQPGQRVLVVGTLTRDGAGAPRLTGSPLVVSTRTEGELLAPAPATTSGVRPPRGSSRRAQLVMTAVAAVVIVALCLFAFVWHG